MALAAALPATPVARAAGFRVFPSAHRLAATAADPPPSEFSIGPCCDGNLAGDPPLSAALDLDGRFRAAPSLVRAGEDLPPPSLEPPPRPRFVWIGTASLLAVGGSFLNAYTDGERYDWHWADEGYFGRHTYVGGGDKASHFVSYYSVARLMTPVFEALDLPEEHSYRLASATSLFAGLATEIGDGMNKYGSSYEDLVLDTAGAAAAFVLARYELNDLIGFRAGLVPAPDTPEQYEPNGTGKDYSKEIYTADFKLAGLSRRLHRRFGPARFLLLSMTYGVKGYPYAPEELRERQVGLEVGLNVAEIARAVGVPERCWWGKIILTILDVVRLPYTAVGVRYDINHRKWLGPDTGQTFSYP